MPRPFIMFTDYTGEHHRELRVLSTTPLDIFRGEHGAEGFDELLRQVGEAAGMGLVLLGHVNADTYTTVAAWARAPPPALSKGAHIPIEETYCRQELTADEPFVMGDALSAGFEEHPGYLKYGLRAYVGAPVVLRDGTTFGTLCAVDTQAHLPSLAAVERLVDVAERVGEEISARLEARRATSAAGAH